VFIYLGRRWPEVGAVVEVLEDPGGRAEVRSWRLTYVHVYRQEVAGGRSSGGGTGGRRGEGGGRELEAELDLHHQAIEEMRAVLQFQVGLILLYYFINVCSSPAPVMLSPFYNPCKIGV
jgi:hypothetical protein